MLNNAEDFCNIMLQIAVNVAGIRLVVNNKGSHSEECYFSLSGWTSVVPHPSYLIQHWTVSTQFTNAPSKTFRC